MRVFTTNWYLYKTHFHTISMVHKRKDLEIGPVFTDQKWKAVIQSENGGEY